MDIVERLRLHPGPNDTVTVQFRAMAEMRLEAADEIARLRAEVDRQEELLLNGGANRYWEGRWRDAEAENSRLRAEVERLTGLLRDWLLAHGHDRSDLRDEVATLTRAALAADGKVT